MRSRTCIQMERTSPIDSMNMYITDSNKIKNYSTLDETPTDRSHHLCKSGETTEDQYEGTDFTIHEHDKTSEPSVNNI